MALVSSKLILAVGTVIAVIIVLAAVFARKNVYTEKLIDAKPEEIWRVLLDVSSYSEWNPFIVNVDGTLEQGNVLKNTIQETNKKPYVIKSKVINISQEQEINQYGGVPGVITFDHYYLLQPADGGTLLIQKEEYRGFWVLFWDHSWVEAEYNKVNQAIGERVDSLRKAEQ